MLRPLRNLALLGLAVSQGACFTWRYASDPTPVVLQRAPNRLWVPVAGDSAIILMQPVLRHDSVVGLIEGSAPGGQRLTTFAQPVVDVPKVATETLNTRFWVRNAIRNAGLTLAVLSTLALGTFIRGVGP